MTAFVHTETFWLQVTNFALAVGCVLAMGVLVMAVFRDLGARRRRLSNIVRLGENPLDGTNLGPTMADGGLPFHGPSDRATR